MNDTHGKKVLLQPLVESRTNSYSWEEGYVGIGEGDTQIYDAGDR